MDEAKSKIVRGTEESGTAMPQMNDERADEIAQGEGEAEGNDLDRTGAVTGDAAPSEEPPTKEEPEEDWYTPRGSSGKKLSKVRPEDEENVPEKLIEQGIEKADDDQRSSSGT